MMQAPIQATRRPAASIRWRQDPAARQRRVARAFLMLLALLVVSVAGNVVQLAWHQAYADDAEKAMGMLRDRAFDAEQELADAQRRLGDWQADYMRQLPQD